LDFIASTHQVTFQHTYKLTIKGFAAKLTPVQVLRMRSHPHVDYVEEDGEVHANQGSCVVEGNADWGLTRVSKRELELDGSVYYPGHGGEGVDVYIVDTGIFLDHVDFEHRAVWGFKSDPNFPVRDDNGHGTHVASTVAGRLYGVAKKATVIAVKVLGAGGSGSWAGVIAGVEYTVQSKNSRGRPSLANMSLGGGVNQAVNAAVKAASEAGVIHVVAAGNSNTDACSFSPASADSIITVGATDVGAGPNDEQEDVRSYFSNFGPCTDVYAPGSDVLGAWITDRTSSRSLSGTSMASPHVCGIGALFMQQNPAWRWSDLSAYITGAATINKIKMNCANDICRSSPNLLAFNDCE